MRKPSLTVDTFVAALAVLGATAPLACSKVDRGAQAVPEPAAAASAAPPKEADPSPAPAAALVAEPAAQAPANATAAAPAAAPADGKPSSPAPVKAAAAAPVGATAVDGGVLNRRANMEEKKKAGMACGAGTCSADMKKGN